MDKYKETVILIDSDKFTLKQLVSILVLILSKININTVSEMARAEGKTPRGIRISNQYKKIKIGKQTLAIKGVTESNLPF